MVNESFLSIKSEQLNSLMLIDLIASNLTNSRESSKKYLSSVIPHFVYKLFLRNKSKEMSFGRKYSNPSFDLYQISSFSNQGDHSLQFSL